MTGPAGFLPLRLVQQPAEVRPGTPHHDSPHREGDLLWHGSHQHMHFFQHGLGVRPGVDGAYIKGGPAHGQGGPGVLLLHQRQKPAEQQKLGCRVLLAPSSLLGVQWEGVESVGSVIQGWQRSSTHRSAVCVVSQTKEELWSLGGAGLSSASFKSLKELFDFFALMRKSS